MNKVCKLYMPDSVARRICAVVKGSALHSLVIDTYLLLTIL